MILTLCLCIPGLIFGQDSTKVYRINKYIDYPIIAAGIAGTAYGAHLRGNKDKSDSLLIKSLKRTSGFAMDKFAMENSSESAGKLSDILFVGGFLLPPALLLNDRVNDNTGDYLTLFLESMAVTGGFYWMTAGLYDKYRPYAYNHNVPMSRRTSHSAKNSFYAGHVAVTATGTFFLAKAFDDHSENKLATVGMYSFATAATVASGYLRMKGGYHFPSDVLIGAAAGAASGILVPQLHKIKGSENLSILPMIGEQKGTYVFLRF